MKNRLNIIAILAGLLLTIGLVAPASAANYTILGGPVGGAWYRIVSGMANIVHQTYPKIDLKAIPGGGVANPERIGTGSADFAITLTVPTILAIDGKKIYHRKMNEIRAIAFGFSPLYIQVVVPKNFPYKTLRAAINHHYKLKIAAPSTSTFGNWITKWLLRHDGMPPSALRKAGGAFYQVSHSQQAELLQDKRANMLITLLAAPAPSVIQVGSQRDLKILDLSAPTVKDMVSEFGFHTADIPTSVYANVKHLEMPHAVRTVTMSSGIIVNSKVPKNVVYKVTKALYEHADEVQKIHPSMKDFIPAQVVKAKYRVNGQVKLAAGAKKYFKEKGYGTN